MLAAFCANRYRILAVVMAVIIAPATLATADQMGPSRIRTQSMPPISTEGYGHLSAPDTSSRNVRTVKVRPPEPTRDSPPPGMRDQKATPRDSQSIWDTTPSGIPKVRVVVPSGPPPVPDHQVLAPPDAASRSAPQVGFQPVPR
jgi:hypothetical protein